MPGAESYRLGVHAYKFLDAEHRAPFTGVEWRPGDWVEAASTIPCHDGVHACRAADVAYWLAASMWHVELDGHTVDTTHKVVGARGRLIGPVDGYDEAMHELRAESAWRSRDRAVAVLGVGANDERDLAVSLAAVSSLADLQRFGDRCDESTFAGRAAALAVDAAHFAVHGTHAQAPFVAACSAGHVAAGPSRDQAGFDAGYAAERRFQSDWLARRLRLA